jgi:LysM repeat protein
MTEELPPTPPKKKPRVQLKPMAPPPLKAPASTISSYRKRQQMGPFIFGSLIVVLLVAGVILLVAWLLNGNGPKITLFATETPTSTVTASPTSTATQTATATVTVTSTMTVPPTPSEPFDYIVQEGDTLTSIAVKFNLGDLGLKKLFAANSAIDPAAPNLNIGQKIKIPNPDYQLPTTTPIPTNLAFGTKITYTIESGDTIAAIAAKFNSTFEDILKENKITDANTIYAGQQIIVRANLVTPTNPPKPTITPGPSPTKPSPFIVTPPGGGPSPTVTLTATPAK